MSCIWRWETPCQEGIRHEPRGRKIEKMRVLFSEARVKATSAMTVLPKGLEAVEVVPGELMIIS